MSLCRADTPGVRVGDVLAERYVVLRVPAEQAGNYVVYDTRALCRVHLRRCETSGDLEVCEVVASIWSRRETAGARAVPEHTAPGLCTAVPRGRRSVAESPALAETPTLPENQAADHRAWLDGPRATQSGPVAPSQEALDGVTTVVTDCAPADLQNGAAPETLVAAPLSGVQTDV